MTRLCSILFWLLCFALGTCISSFTDISPEVAFFIVEQIVVLTLYIGVFVFIILIPGWSDGILDLDFFFASFTAIMAGYLKVIVSVMITMLISWCVTLIIPTTNIFAVYRIIELVDAVTGIRSLLPNDKVKCKAA